MNPKTARRILATHFEDPNDDIPSAVEKALVVIEKNLDLAAEYKTQSALDKKASRLLGDIEIPDPVIDQLTHTISSLPASRFRWNDPAILAVLTGIVLLAFVVAWDFMGRPAAFPGDAMEVAADVFGIADEKFEPAGIPAGEMEDWFVLKGFEEFIAPGPLAAMPASSAALLNSGRVPVAVVEIPDHNLRVANFDAAVLDIRMSEMEWRFIQLEPSMAAALRVEDGRCVLVIHPGPVETLKRLLD